MGQTSNPRVTYVHTSKEECITMPSIATYDFFKFIVLFFHILYLCASYESLGKWHLIVVGIHGVLKGIMLCEIRHAQKNIWKEIKTYIGSFIFIACELFMNVSKQVAGSKSQQVDIYD